MPSVQAVHIDKMLSNISVGYKNEEFVADMIFKPVSVDKQSDRYYVYGKEIFRVHEDRRAPGTVANELNWKLSHDTFFCEGHALREGITDEEIKNADDIFQLETDATEQVTKAVLLNKEIDAASKLLDSSNYDSNLVLATGGVGQPKKWSDADSDPVRDVEKIKEKMHKLSGLKPNTFVLSQPVFNILKVHPKLLAYFKVSELSIVTLEQMRLFFDIPNIIIASALKSNNINPDGEDELSYIFGNSAVLAFVPDRPAKKTPALGYSFMWNKDGQGPVQVRKYYEQAPKTTYVEAERYYDHKIVSNTAGALFPDVVVPLSA